MQAPTANEPGGQKPKRRTAVRPPTLKKQKIDTCLFTPEGFENVAEALRPQLMFIPNQAVTAEELLVLISPGKCI